LKKEFGSGNAKVLALRGVDFDVRFGETTFLVGPSGCGKTTLLSVIAGLLDSTAGEVELFGENVERFRPEKRILFRRKNLGFVFQQYNLLPALTAAENAAVPLLASTRFRARFPADSSNASRSPARSFTIRGWSSATSRPPRSTTRPAKP
jgi:putative ABC transport system ATP-binding protein